MATDTYFKCLEKMLLTIGSMNAEWFFNFFNYVRLEMNLPPKKTKFKAEIKIAKINTCNDRTV